MSLLLAAGNVVAATVGRRFARQRKVLITLNGARFLVSEDDIDQWLETKEYKVIKDATAPRKVRGKPIAVPVKLDIEQIKVIEAPDYVIDRVTATNRRIAQRIRSYNQSLDEEDELILWLM